MGRKEKGKKEEREERRKRGRKRGKEGGEERGKEEGKRRQGREERKVVKEGASSSEDCMTSAFREAKDYLQATVCQ